MIEILRGHSNADGDGCLPGGTCLSDRNPTWPLKLYIIIKNKQMESLSDRNLTWPLKPAMLFLMVIIMVSVIEILRGHSNP